MIRSVFRPVRPPILPVPDRVWHAAALPGEQLVRLVTVGSLPRTLRRRLGLRWTRERELALRAQQEAIRRLFPLLPDRLRLMPPAFAAERGRTQLAA